MNKRDLTWVQKAAMIAEETCLPVTDATLKRFVGLRLIDQESKPLLQFYRNHAVKWLAEGLNAKQVRLRIKSEFGHTYSDTAVQRMCKSIKEGGKQKAKKKQKGSWGADFYTGSLRTMALCRPWNFDGLKEIAA